MEFSAIATILHDPGASAAPFELAISMARKSGAHLHVLCAGVDATDPGVYYMGSQAVAVHQNVAMAKENALEVENFARRRLSREDINWDLEVVTMLPGSFDPFLGDTMRFFDLIVLPTPYEKTRGHVNEIAFESCLFRADRPVIVVPDDAKTDANFGRVLVAWDDGNQAMAAAHAATPIVATADMTTIAIIEPPTHSVNRSDPGGKLANYLAGKGGNIDVTVLAKTLPSVSAVLLHRVAEQGTKLLVMGAYGHSRMREALVGGTTRDTLRNVNIPVLMAR